MSSDQQQNVFALLYDDLDHITDSMVDSPYNYNLYNQSVTNSSVDNGSISLSSNIHNQENQQPPTIIRTTTAIINEKQGGIITTPIITHKDYSSSQGDIIPSLSQSSTVLPSIETHSSTTNHQSNDVSPVPVPVSLPLTETPNHNSQKYRHISNHSTYSNPVSSNEKYPSSVSNHHHRQSQQRNMFSPEIFDSFVQSQRKLKQEQLGLLYATTTTTSTGAISTPASAAPQLFKTNDQLNTSSSYTA